MYGRLSKSTLAEVKVVENQSVQCFHLHIVEKSHRHRSMIAIAGDALLNLSGIFTTCSPRKPEDLADSKKTFPSSILCPWLQEGFSREGGLKL